MREGGTAMDTRTQPDPADRRWFVVDDERWQEVRDLLDRPPVFKPRLAALLADEG